jgi:hypothetical protein
MAVGVNALVAGMVMAVLGLPGVLSGGSSPPAPPKQAPAPLERPFSPTSFWNSPLSADSALHADAGGLSVALATQERSFGAWMNTTSYSAPIYVVPANQGGVRVQIDHAPSPNVEALQAEMASVPIPAGARPAAGSDARMIIWQPSTDTMWEFWHVRYESLWFPRGWHAGWGAKITGASKFGGVNPPPFGATASGLALAGGLITLDDMRRGSIDHVLALGVPRTRAGVFVAPANRTDGKFTGPYAIPEGTRYRLDPSLDVDSLGLSPIATMIARAAQRYGMVVRDGSELVTFYGQDPTPTGTNPWPAWFGGKSPADALAGFPWDKLQTLPPAAG